MFQNGDVLTGQVLAISNDSITFRHQVLGNFVAAWSAVAQVESTNRSLAASLDNRLSGAGTAFKTAMFTRPKDVVTIKLDYEQPRLALAALTFTDPPCPETAQASLTSSSDAPPASGAVRNWVLAVNSPASLAYGTASQMTLGGLATVDVYEGELNHSKLAAGGSYNRSWQIGSPSITTDTLDAFFQQGRSFGSNRGGVYAKAETYLNTSLGLAREDSFGGGYYSRNFTGGPFQFKWLADLRYFREQLYATDALNLVGSRFEGQLIYRKKDPTDNTKTKYDVILKAWVNPMWNHESAFQGFASAQISFPLGQSVCLAFSPIEDDYLGNPPAGNRRNYATSSISLKIQHGSNPNQRCY